jgi:hypothetical protein
MKGLDFKKTHTGKKLAAILEELDLEVTCNHLRLMCLVNTMKADSQWDPRMLKQLE